MGMPLGATLQIGLDSLRGNRLRTLLATSGVVIGVAALVSVLALGDGMERLGRSQIERASSLKLIAVTPKTVQSRDRLLVPIADPITLGPADLASLREHVPDAELVMLQLEGAVEVTLPGVKTLPAAPARGSVAAYTSLATRACTIAPAHIAQGSSVT